MSGIVLYATGSSIILDVEESLHRAGVTVAAAIRNRPGTSYVSTETLGPEGLPSTILNTPFLVPLFTPGHRQEAAAEAKRLGFKIPYTLIDPTTVIPRNLEAGDGTYVNAGCVIGAASRFGPFAFVNRGASIGHHVVLEPFVSIGPSVVIAGLVTIAAGAMIGAGATILPELKIGANAVIGAGSVVTRDVPDNAFVVGSPARVRSDNIGGYKGISVASDHQS